MFKTKLTNYLQQQTKQKINLEIPPNPKLGDYAIHTYKYKIPKELKLPPYINKTEIKGPYLNFFIKKHLLAKETINNILKPKHKTTKTKYIIEYSQPNTHKAFHIGHIRGTSLGESTARILEYQGNKVLRINYMGDTGAHVAKWLWCYQKYHKNEQPPKIEPERWIANIYVEAVNKLKNKDLQQEVDKINKQLETKSNKQLIQLWKKSRQWSLKEFKKIYKDLNTKFDAYYFERQVEQKGKKIAKQMKKQGLAKIDQEALVIDLKKYNLGIFLLLRKDNTCLYSIKDIGLAYKRYKKYKPNQTIYFIGAAQSLHMKQVFKTLEILQFKHVKDCIHIPFTEVRLPEGKMSSRTGKNILYIDIKKQLFKQAEKEIKKRHPKWPETKIQKITKQISIAAIKYSMLSQDPNKIITFNPKKALEFEGETGPYIQYTHARACSILKKAKLKPKINYKLFTEQQELALINHLSTFNQSINQSATQYKPALVTHYAIDLCQKFNEFYHTCPVIKAKSRELTNARLLLTKATQLVINHSLNLLGIDAPKEM